MKTKDSHGVAARPPQLIFEPHLAGLISRPRLEPGHQSLLGQAGDAELEALLVPTGPLQRIAPLVAHHLTVLRPSLAPVCTPVLRRAARDDFRRANSLRELLDALADARLPEPVLVQGTALAPRYPAPALRPSVDLDLLIHPASASDVRKVLVKLGWRNSGGVWVHPNRSLLDLHLPATALSQHLLKEAQPHPKVLGAMQPPDGLQLVLLARHCGRHRGDRLWRDMADLQLLTDNGRLGAVVETALARSPRDTAAPLAALLQFANRYTEPAVSFPNSRQPAGDYLRLLEHQARWCRPAAELDLLESLFNWPIWRKRRTSAPSPQAIRTDPMLGRVPAPGWRLQAYKVRTAMVFLASRDGWRGVQLLRLRQRCEIRTADFTAASERPG
jgi:hypothetical protein